MNLYIYFLSVLLALASCNGQNNSNETNPVKDEIVTELGNNIMVIYQDKKNNYWFGSWENGLYKYDGKTMLHFTTKNGLPHNRIEEIKEDHSGNVYFSTSGGIVQFDGANFHLLKVAELESQWKLEPNDLWFKDGWNSGTILRYDGNLLYRLQLPKTELGEEYIAKSPTHPNPYSVYSIYKDSKGNVWFGTGALGAFRYDGNSFEWILEKDVVEIFNQPSEGANGVRSIIEDKDGYFWFNSNFRYNIYNKKDESFYLREKSIGSLDSKKDGNLVEYLSITKDNNQTLWIATYDAGVYQYDGKNITHYSVQDNGKEIKLFSIYKDNHGDLWLGTHANAAYKFNGKSFERFKF